MAEPTTATTTTTTTTTAEEIYAVRPPSDPLPSDCSPSNPLAAAWAEYFTDLTTQIKRNAAIVWAPSSSSAFEVRLQKDGDLVFAVLVERMAAGPGTNGKGMLMPRTRSGVHGTEVQAAEDVDRQVTYMAEEKRELEA